MKNPVFSVVVAAMILLSTASGISFANAAAEEFHSSANMRYGERGLVPEAHGYLRVISDASGNGLIDVMFSNSNPDLQALFNASVRLLDASGRIVVETHFNCRLGDASFDGAGECKVSKPLQQTLFVSVEVDFYLSDTPGMKLAAHN